MDPISKILQKGEEGLQAGSCTSCLYLNGIFNGSRKHPPVLAPVHGCLLCGYFVLYLLILSLCWVLVIPRRRHCRSSGLLQGFCLACWSLLSEADLHVNGFPRILRVHCPEGEKTQSVSREPATFQRDQWSRADNHCVNENHCCALYRFLCPILFFLLQFAYAVCADRISSTCFYHFFIPLPFSALSAHCN